eukprot:TRINITY_DN3048_c0_g2_i1.p1 TRINITY_DN3048_c0_g2~~TRINITY_DN3048_c0_g2_i1.p1  ORF type:complete len:309 (-),score=69.91 TRINITY_DN3048_c0_g2_i1:49-975(-)
MSKKHELLCIPPHLQTDPKKRNSGKAIWRPKEGKAEVIQNSKNVNNCGVVVNSKQMLNIEEVVYLVDGLSLELYMEDDREHSLLLPQCYALLPAGGSSLSEYLVYAHLKRLGFIVFRSGLLQPLKPPPKPEATAAASTSSSSTITPTTSSLSPSSSSHRDRTTEPLLNNNFQYRVRNIYRNWWPPNSDVFESNSENNDSSNGSSSDSTKSSKSETRSTTSATSSSSTSKKKELTSSFRFSFDVYKPNSKFSKKRAGTPDFRLCVCKYQSPMPELNDTMHLTSLSWDAPVLYAVNDFGSISFYHFGTQL